MKKIKLTETVLRDGQQSLIATRMKTSEMLPILEALDNIGYNALEVWGGATFDTCLRFLNEDPWERLRTIRKNIKNTKLQMLLRGQNLVGYRHYADDVVDEFVKKSIENGIDIIRIFDALNDGRNLEKAISSTKKYGGHVQGTMSYTVSPVHTIEVFANYAKELEEMGSDSICIKDMAGLLDPFTAFKLVKAIKEKVSVPIEIHTHATNGLGNMTYLKAIEAGVDIIDTSISSFGGGSSQPATESMVATLQNSEYSTDLDLDALGKIASYFRPIRDNYIAEGKLQPKVMWVDIKALTSQIPGGMISNLLAQLREANALDKYGAVLREIPQVRKELGYPPLVTPTSQMVGTQAFFNVITGNRYQIVSKEIKMLVKGMYGRTIQPVDPEIKARILKDEEQITCRPADLLEPELEKTRKEFAQYIRQDEDVLSAAVFPQQAEAFFKNRI
ncbi:MAG: oxaloacetate decarboxylase subunit alpha [Clostridia bacterium]|nr:oxaloacetate decarboxylase subunit alpha [Clostridia bacterium]